MRKMNKSAFTLVELIVVITILAILATVAFISLGGQTDNARNTVKKDAIGKLATAVENARVNSIAISSFAADNWDVLTNATDEISWVLVTTAATAGNIGAGDINLSALDVKADDFKDGTNNYKFGYSKFRGGKYEVAGSLKQGEFPVAYLVGNYEPRTYATITWTGNAGEKSFKITADTDIKKLYIGDTTDLGKVTWISDDYKTIRLDTAIPSGWVTSIILNGSQSAETAGLIDSTTTGTPVTDGSQNVPY